MIWWVGFLVVLSALSYLNDTGVLTFLADIRVPFLHASLLSSLILVSAAGILLRMLWMRKKGEREALRERIARLERASTSSR